MFIRKSLGGSAAILQSVRCARPRVPKAAWDPYRLLGRRLGGALPGNSGGVEHRSKKVPADSREFGTKECGVGKGLPSREP